MGWFGKKNQFKSDPQTGLVSVKVGDTWIQERPEMMVTRDLMGYFRGKNYGPHDAIRLTAWVCGFMAGSLVYMGGTADPDQPGIGKLAQDANKRMTDETIRDAVAEGMEAGREGQNPALREAFEKAQG